jgi:hypothetical protein
MSTSDSSDGHRSNIEQFDGPTVDQSKRFT